MSSKVVISLGCDPELALISNNKYIAACGLIGGTKQAPMRIDGTNTDIQEDGVMVEFNTPACTSFDSFWDQSQQSYREVREFVNYKNPTFQAHIIDGVKYDKEQLVSEQANTLGCDPDCLAHLRGLERRPPTIEQLKNLRCAGGHLHIGYPNKGDGKGQIPGWVMVQFIEAGAYFPYYQYDQQALRRPFYGLAGLYREKPYGIEYRTPSARWLSGQNASYQFIENAWRIARWVCKNGTKAQTLWEEIDFDAIAGHITKGTYDQNLLQTTYDSFTKAGAYGG